MLVIIGFCCMLIGVIGLSLVPGAPMSWIGLALLYFTTVIPANYWILSITLVTIITSILEYIIRPEEQNDSEVPMAFGEKYRTSCRSS
jgi:hypothetical protein